MLKYHHFAVLAGAMLFVSACENASTGPDDQAPAPGDERFQVAGDPAAHPEEREFQEFGREVPGFGGFHYDANGNLVVTVTEPGNLAGAARARLDAKLVKFKADVPQAQRAQRGAGRLVVRKGQYTFAQLAGWRDEAVSLILGIPGVIFVDLDEAENRVAVGIDRARFASVRGEVTSALAQGHIPPAALTFHETSPVVSEQTTTGALTDRRRPLIGGLAIDFSVNGVYLDSCTLGFIAEQNGRRGFVTNSHCSYQYWRTENTEYHQSAFDGGSSIGFEYKDSNGSSCGFLSSRNCRRSDATFAQASVEAELGSIAITSSVGGPGRPAEGSKEIREGNQHVIVAKVSSTSQGDIVDKVGRTTGWTTGYVERSCVEISVSSNQVLRCQHYTSYGSGPGDSGSPVFTTEYRFVWLNPYRVALRGVHWGATTDGVYAIFSPVTGIESDLGTLTVF